MCDSWHFSSRSTLTWTRTEVIGSHITRVFRLTYRVFLMTMSELLTQYRSYWTMFIWSFAILLLRLKVLSGHRQWTWCWWVHRKLHRVKQPIKQFDNFMDVSFEKAVSQDPFSIVNILFELKSNEAFSWMVNWIDSPRSMILINYLSLLVLRKVTSSVQQRVCWNSLSRSSLVKGAVRGVTRAQLKNAEIFRVFWLI